MPDHPSPPGAPRITLVTPVFDPPLGALLACLASVQRQSFTEWEWCIVDDCSTRPEVRATLEQAGAADPRIRLHRRASNGGIVAASNDALAMATGEFVALLDHDDTLTVDALATVMSVLDGPAGSDVDYLYTDEAHALADGREAAHFLKPDWSPERFRSSMYTCHLSVFRRRVLDEIGGFRTGFDGSQDHDLVLRATEMITARNRRIVHLPVLAYHWRNVSSSVSRAAETVTAAVENGRRAVQEHCDRVGIGAVVVHGPVAGTYRLVRTPPPSTTVTVAIASRFEGAAQRPYRLAVAETLRRVVATVDRPAAVVVAHPAELPGALTGMFDEEFAATSGPVRVDRVPVPGEWSIAAALDRAALMYPADVLVSLAPGMRPVSAEGGGWLDALVGSALEPGVGIVGALITDTGRRVVHAGWDVPNYRWYELEGLRAGTTTSGNDLLIERECSHVSLAAAAIAMRSWREARHRAAGGWHEGGRAFSDAVRSMGARVVWTPHAHLEQTVVIEL